MPRQEQFHALINLLRRQVDHGQRLLEHMQVEHSFLQGRDAEAIARSIEGRQPIVSGFETLERQRQQLTRALGESGYGEELERALQDRGSALHGLWQQLHELAHACQKQNLVNGGIAELGRQKSQRYLEILRGNTQRPNLYGRAGQQDRGETTQHLAVA